MEDIRRAATAVGLSPEKVDELTRELVKPDEKRIPSNRAERRAAERATRRKKI